MINQNYARTYEASPHFQWENAELTASSSDVVSWESYSLTSKKYLPFDYTRIVNNGESDIMFYPNQSKNGIFIPKGTIYSADARSIPAISSFKITNVGSTTLTAGKVIITNHRDGQTTDSIIERLHKRLFSKNTKRLI